MTLTLIAGSAHPVLAEAVALELGIPLHPVHIERFPDGETHVEILQSVRNHDVFLLEPTGPSVNRHVTELLLLTDAAKRAGAARVTAVMPYFGYARQDRRVSGREAIGAKVMTEIMGAAGVDRLVAVDLHSAGVEGFAPFPVEQLSAARALSERLTELVPEGAVVVAPDLGAAKLAEYHAARLGLGVAVVRKVRTSSCTVEARQIIGEVRQRPVVIVDDMISTGGTVLAAARAAIHAGCLEPIVAVAASHGLFVGPAASRLRQVAPSVVVVSDSLPEADPAIPHSERVSLAPLLGEAVSCLYDGRSLSHLIRADH